MPGGGGVDEYTNKLFNGLISQIFNTPIDLFIERYLFDRFETLRPFQLISLYNLTKEYLDGATNKKVVEVIPQYVISRNKILSLVSSMQFAELFHLDYVNDFKPTSDELKIATSFYDDYKNIERDTPQGIEYDLIRKWSKRLQIDSMFNLASEDEYLPARETESSTISHEDTEMARFLQSQEVMGTNPAVVMYMIGAMEFLSKLPIEEVKKIALEIATIGMSGISPDKNQYQVPSIPNQSFSGYQLLSYYYVSFSLAFPELLTKLQLPYKDEFEIAKQYREKGF